MTLFFAKSVVSNASAIAAVAARTAKNMAEVSFFIVKFLVFSGVFF